MYERMTTLDFAKISKLTFERRMLRYWHENDGAAPRPYKKQPNDVHTKPEDGVKQIPIKLQSLG